MNTTIENHTSTATRSTSQTTTRVRRPAAVTATPIAPAEQPPALPLKRPASELTRLVFMAILGCAACIAVVGVISEAGASGTSPDDPPPVLIID